MLSILAFGLVAYKIALLLRTRRGLGSFAAGLCGFFAGFTATILAFVALELVLENPAMQSGKIFGPGILGSIVGSISGCICARQLTTRVDGRTKTS